MDVRDVKLSRRAIKDLKKAPQHVVLKLQAWVDAVATYGHQKVKSIRGFHDESLKGKRLGQRSIRLSKAYRAIYQIDKRGKIDFIEIQEVNKHEY